MSLPKITNKQQDILYLLYRFRFLTRVQIQALLKHKTFNRVNVWLKDLVAKQYIGKIQDTSLKLNITPIKYYIEKNGIRYLKTKSECKREYIERLYADRKRSTDFVNRSTFIGDIYINLYLIHANNECFSFYTQSDFSVEGIVKEIFPHFVYRKDEQQPYYIGEIFSEKTPRYAIRSRITQYLHFFTKNDWINNELSPNLLFISPNTELENYLLKKTKNMMNNEEKYLNIFITTEDQIKEKGFSANIWQQVELDK